MKPISRKTHSVLDYLMGVLLLSGPYLFGFDGSSIESTVLFISGGAVIFYSLLTNYELGLIKVLPMKVHLTLDILSGLFLAASAWVFEFSRQTFLPHLTLGLIEIITAVLTSLRKKSPSDLIDFPK